MSADRDHFRTGAEVDRTIRKNAIEVRRRAVLYKTAGAVDSDDENMLIGAKPGLLLGGKRQRQAAEQQHKRKDYGEYSFCHDETPFNLHRYSITASSRSARQQSVDFDKNAPLSLPYTA